MSQKIFTILLLAVVFCGCANNKCSNDCFLSVERYPLNQIRERILDASDSCVLVVAHRGDWRFAPENSVAAINRSIELGVDMIEVDIQKTSDGVLVLMHDNTIDRTTTGKGVIEEWSYDSLQTLYLRNGCGAVTRHKIPTLLEALNTIKGKAMINLDKGDRYFDEIFAILDSTNTVESVVMKGRSEPAVVREKFGKYLDKIIYMPVVKLDEPNALEMIDTFEKELNSPAYELVFADPDNRIVKEVADRLHNAGKTVWFNTLWATLAGGLDDDAALEDADGVYGYLIDSLNTRMIQTDRSEQLLQYLRNKNLHK